MTEHEAPKPEAPLTDSADSFDDPWNEPKLSPDHASDFGEPQIEQIQRRWVIGVVAMLAFTGVGSAVYAMAHRTKTEQSERELNPRPYGNAQARVPESIRQLEIATTPAVASDKPEPHANTVPDSTLTTNAAPDPYDDTPNAEADDTSTRDKAGYESQPKYAANTSKPPKRHQSSDDGSESASGSDDELPSMEMPAPKKSDHGGRQDGETTLSLPPGMGGSAPGGEQIAKLAAALQQAQGQGDDDDRKESFIAKGGGVGPDIEGATDIGECEVSAGTPIHVSIQNAVNTDLPSKGTITAQVVQTVYCGAEHQHIAIPQGSTFSVSADPHVTYGQERILMCVERLRLRPSASHPTGQKVRLGCMAVADITGQVGLPAEVDNHWLQLINGALLSTVLSLGANASMGNQEGFAPTMAQNAVHGAGANISQVGQRIVQRDLQRKPTLRTEQLEFSMVLFNADVQLEPWLPRVKR